MDLITGLGWNKTLLLETRGESKEVHSVQVGDPFNFEFSANRECVGFRSPGSPSLKPCPEGRTGLSSSQCEKCLEAAKILPCLRCTGEICRNSARRSECVVDMNHALYIAAFSDQHLKVGVARWNRRMVRLSEQGARQALIVARDDGQMIRRSEAMAKRLGIPDRMSPTRKLEAHAIACSKENMNQALTDALHSLKARMRANWVGPEKFSRSYRDLSSTRLISPGGGSFQGEVHEIVGQIITVKDPSGEIIALDASSLIGRRVKESEGANYQMSLSGQLGA